MGRNEQGVTRPSQCHDEDPGAQQLPGARVENLGPLAEVDLRGLAGVELQHGGHLRVSGLEGCEKRRTEEYEPVKPWLRTRAPWMVAPWMP